MGILVALFVGKPVTILAFAALICVAGIALHSQPERKLKGRPLFAVAGAWTVYALWEWLVMIWTPEANIRVDLLLIWPVLASFTLWGVYRLFR